MNPNCGNCTNVVDLAFASLYSLIFMVGLPLNITALCIFIFGEAGRSITATYMKNLAACDLLLLVSLPLRVYYYGWRPLLSPTICEVAGLLLLVNTYGSIFLLTCLSWDRCMAVCFPLSHWPQLARQQARGICAGVWALSLVGTIPTYFMHMGDTQNNSTLCFDRQPHYVRDPTISGTMLLGFALPLAIMVTCSYSLLCALHRSAAVQMELLDGVKIQRMVMTNVGIFLGCFLPYHMAVLCYQVSELHREHLDMAYQCGLLLACANASLDPLAYYFTTKTFQHLVRKDISSGTRAPKATRQTRLLSTHPWAEHIALPQSCPSPVMTPAPEGEDRLQQEAGDTVP